MKIFFDFDGTLVDVSDRHYQVYKSLVENYEGVPLAKSVYWKLKRSKVNWKEILEKSSLSPSLLTEFLDDFRLKIEDPQELSKDTLVPNAVLTLKKLNAENELLLVSLRRHGDRLLDQVKSLGIDGYFVNILSGHSDERNELPKVKLIDSITKEKGSILVGDTESDIDASKDLGFISIAIATGLRNKTELKRHHPDYLLQTIEEVPEIIELVSAKSHKNS
jgi:phosphoglycolate phosphatase-like HAD superfamily hydrolase